jgi:ATP-dependent DNA ligase
MFDGELVAVDGGGKAAFASMQVSAEDLSVCRESTLFDFLHLDSHHLTSLPLVNRKNHLKAPLAFSFDGLKFGDPLRGDGERGLLAACGHGRESAITRPADAACIPGRCRHGLKAKYVGIDEIIIDGLRPFTKVDPPFALRQVGERTGSRLDWRARRNPLGRRDHHDIEE